MQTTSIIDKTKSLFEHKQKPVVEQSVSSNQVNELNVRLKMVEERYTGLRRKTQVTEHNLISTNRRISTEVKTITSDINDIRRALLDIHTMIKEIKEELSSCAKKDELNLLNKYISFWEPLNYVTAAEVEKIAKDIVEKK